jgi:hypothetical protein
MADYEYVDPDDPFGDVPKKGRPKWQIPKNPNAIRILEAVGRKYYLNRDEQAQVNDIAKAMLPLQKGIESKYPTEWVENCLDWVRKKRSKGETVMLKGLLSLIRNQDRYVDWLAGWKRKNGPTMSNEVSDTATKGFWDE